MLKLGNVEIEMLLQSAEKYQISQNNILVNTNENEETEFTQVW